MADQVSTADENAGIRDQLAAARQQTEQQQEEGQAAQQQTGQASDQQAGQEQATPPWGHNFDAERAWSLIQNLRSDKTTRDQRIAQLEADRTQRERADMNELDRTKAELADIRKQLEES